MTIEPRRFGAGRLAAGLAGAGLAAGLLVARALATATPQAVYFNGSELGWECSVRQMFGVPCPSCGLTRSVLLTLHGHLGAALGVNPGGPLVVLGLLLLAALMLAFALRPGPRPSGGLVRRLVLGASAYGGLTGVVLLVHWLRAL